MKTIDIEKVEPTNCPIKDNYFADCASCEFCESICLELGTVDCVYDEEDDEEENEQ